MGAALGAAWAGASVVLVERFGFLGGNPTAALVNPLMSWHTQGAVQQDVDDTRLLPQDHGPGDPVVAGALQVFLDRLIAAEGAVSPSLETGYTVPFDPETYKSVALELLDEAGVRMLFHAFASGILADGGPAMQGRAAAGARGVVLETKSGPIAVAAPVVIDCTGDADLAAQAGARFQVGREGDGRVQPMTLMFRLGGVDQDRFNAYIRDNPGQWRGVHGLWDLVAKASEAGDLDLPREDILFFATPHRGELSVNCTRVTAALGTDVFDLSRAEIEARRQMRQIAAFFRKYVPGFASSYVIQSGTTVGVRETRRIEADYVLTAQDVLEARKFPDAIARASYPIDIHNPTGKGTVLRKLPPGEWYEVPMRSLLPRGVENLLVAGRAIGGTHEAHSSYRVTPTAMATGQAAGVCAALAVRQRRGLRDVPTAEVQAELRRQGAAV